MKHLKLYNESIRHLLKPKSEEEIVEKLPVNLREIYTKSKENGWDVNITFNPYSKTEIIFNINFGDFRVAVAENRFGGGLSAEVFIYNTKRTHHTYSGNFVDFEDLKRKITNLQSELNDNQNTNESIKDKLTPKPEEEIRKSVEKLSPREKMRKACQYNMPWLAQDAIDSGYKIKDVDYDNCLYNIVNNNGIDVLKILVKHGVGKGVLSDYLFNAVSQDRLEIVKIMFENGCHVNDEYYDEDEEVTILEKSFLNNNIEMMKLLLENGAEPYISLSLLKNKIKYENIEMLKYLINVIPFLKKEIEKIYDERKKQIDIIEKVLK